MVNLTFSNLVDPRLGSYHLELNPNTGIQFFQDFQAALLFFGSMSKSVSCKYSLVIASTMIFCPSDMFPAKLLIDFFA